MPKSMNGKTTSRSSFCLPVLLCASIACERETRTSVTPTATVGAIGQAGSAQSPYETAGFHVTSEHLAASPAHITEHGIKALAGWIEAFRQANGAVPTRLEQIVHPDPTDRNFLPPERWWNDGWDRRFIYERTAEGYRLTSLGADGKPGTGDEITWSWPPGRNP